MKVSRLMLIAITIGSLLSAFGGFSMAATNTSSGKTQTITSKISKTPPNGGKPLKVYMPTPGFNPLTASNKELVLHGYPRRPTNPAALKAWTKAMKHALHFSTPTPHVGTKPIAPPSKYSGTASYWSGYVALSSNNSDEKYNNTSANWVVPSVTGNPNYPPSTYDSTAPRIAFWTGIGGWNTTSPTAPIVQAGVASIATSTPEYRFWTEDYPYNPVYEGPVINPGDEAYVVISYNTNGTTNYWLEDETTGDTQSFTNSSPYYDGSSADFVSEAGNHVPQFPSEPFSNCYDGWAGGGTSALYPQYTTQAIMTDSSGNIEVYPSGINSSTDGFTEYWSSSS